MRACNICGPMQTKENIFGPFQVKGQILTRELEIFLDLQELIWTFGSERVDINAWACNICGPM